MSEPNSTDDTDDPLGSVDMIREAFALVQGDARAVTEEGQAVVALAESWQTYVETHHRDFIQGAEAAVRQFETDVVAWQNETQADQERLQTAQAGGASANAKGTARRKRSASSSS